MAPVGSTLVALLCLLGSSALSREIPGGTEWTCPPITPQKNVALDQALGNWYLAEVSANNGTFNNTLCYNWNFSAVNESTIALRAPDIKHFSVADQEKPWLWSVEGHNLTLQVLHLTADKLVLSRCQHPRTTLDYLLLSRRTPLSEAEWQGVHQALGAAGVEWRAELNYWQAAATCPAA